MAILNTKDLKSRAAQLTSEHRSDTRKLVLIYTGVIALLGLGSNALQFYLDSQIGTTGGLSGLGARSVLQTIQEVLNYVNMFFGPFWAAGFLYAMLNLVRGKNPEGKDLLAGFRRFGRVLGYVAFEFLVTLLILIAVMNLATIVFSYSPWGTSFAEDLEPLLADPNLFLADGTINLELIPYEAVLSGAIPLIVIFLVIFIPVFIYVSYCLRMAMYLIMERKISSFRSLTLSTRMMRGHKWQLLKLDLSFWWYYLLGGVISVVGYLDLILAMLGISLPMDETVLFFVTLIAYYALSLGLYLWKKCQVDAAYVLAFEAIAYPEPVETLTKTE